MLATGRGRHQEEDEVSRFTQKKVLADAPKIGGAVRIRLREKEVGSG
jgi:hypothetical protein